MRPRPSGLWIPAPGFLARFVLLATCLLLNPGIQAEVIDRIAISVGNKIIAQSQIDEEIRLTAFLNKAKLDLNAEERKKAASRLIEQTLVRREMDLSRYPLPDPSEAAAALKSLKAGYPSPAQYQQALQQYGVTEEDLLGRLEWQMTLMHFIDFRFRPGIQVPDADMQAYYQQQLAKWQQQGTKPIPTFDDSRESIEQILTEQRIDQAVDKWLSETRGQVPIRYLDEALQ
ncbi:MAG TPA: hypothetical protein VEU96_07510 [Bryobacteraceae bacterium]|nr:hypothetical protein [Bryobacteraceae bacterium]